MAAMERPAMAGDFEDRLASLLMIAASGNDAEALAALRTAGSCLMNMGSTGQRLRVASRSTACRRQKALGMAIASKRTG